MEEYRKAVFAYNQTFSQSGYAAPYSHMVPFGFWFEDRLHTNQHLESGRAVAEGRADIASLDAVSWRLMERFEPFSANLRVLDWTEPTPGLPLITAQHQQVDQISSAVAVAISGLKAQDRKVLGIEGVVKLPKEKYLAVPNPPEHS